MQRIRLIHEKAPEAVKGTATLRAAGYTVAAGALTPAVLRRLRTDPPAAVVIDLTRAPSRGRDIAVALRTYRSTRPVPIVFAGGEPTKTAPIKKLLPDAVYTTWARIRSALKRAIASPPAHPVVPGSVFAAYAGVPLIKKLGIKPGSVVGLLGAPKGFHRTLGALPARAVLRRDPRGRCDLVVWFVTSRKDLDRGIGRVAVLAGRGGLWIAWPKKASGMTTDVTQAAVRAVGLAAGLVDYKVCAIDATWTGLRFTHRAAR